MLVLGWMVGKDDDGKLFPDCRIYLKRRSVWGFEQYMNHIAVNQGLGNFHTYET